MFWNGNVVHTPAMKPCCYTALPLVLKHHCSDYHPQAKEDPKSTYEEDNLVQSIFDLFVAGIETTTTTLRWALLYMLVYPDIQGEMGSRNKPWVVFV